MKSLEVKDIVYFLFPKNEEIVSQLPAKFIISILLYLNFWLWQTKYLNKNGDYFKLKILRILI
jgi:hypothetical protein